MEKYGKLSPSYEQPLNDDCSLPTSVFFGNFYESEKLSLPGIFPILLENSMPEPLMNIKQ